MFLSEDVSKPRFSCLRRLIWHPTIYRLSSLHNTRLCNETETL